MGARLLQFLGAAWRCARRYPYFLVAAPLLIALSISFLRRADSEWETVYVVAANHLRQGVDIYTDGNAYPPFAACTALPASYLPPSFVRLTWLLVSLVCCVVMLRGAWRLAGGGRLQGDNKPPFREHLAAILGFLCGMGYLQNCLAHQQNDLVIGAVLVVGCAALQRSHSLGAATCFGLAAALKCTALLWFPYLLWRGRPFAAAWLLCVALGVNLLPNLISSPPSGRLWLTEYTTRFIEPLFAKDHVAGTWWSDVMYNQSLAGAGQRWFVLDREFPMRPEVLHGVVLAMACALVAITLWICGRPFQKLQARIGNSIQPEAGEYGLVLLLMLLLSPMSSKAHFGVLIVPGFVLARAALASRNWLLGGCFLIPVGLALLSNKDPLGEDLYTLTLWYGSVTWQALLLMAGCLGLVWHINRKKNGAALPCQQGLLQRAA